MNKRGENMDITKTVFGFNLSIEIENNLVFNFEFKEEDETSSHDLCYDNWLLCVITRNGTPILGKEYWE